MSLFEHPTEWIDKRHTARVGQLERESSQASDDKVPDFMHMSTGMELRVGDESTPDWAKKKLRAVDRKAAAYWARVRF